MELFTVFPLGSVEDSLHYSLEELVEHRKTYKKTIDDETLQARLQEYKGNPNKPALRRNVVSRGENSVLAFEALALVDPAAAKKMKFKEQMKLAKRKRKISIKQRNKMYEMISTDEISEFFHQQARKADINVVKWGNEEEEEEVDDPFFVSEDESSEDSDEEKAHTPSTRDRGRVRVGVPRPGGWRHWRGEWGCLTRERHLLADDGGERGRGRGAEEKEYHVFFNEGTQEQGRGGLAIIASWLVAS